MPAPNAAGTVEHELTSRDLVIGAHAGGGNLHATTAAFLTAKALVGDNVGTAQEGDFFQNSTSGRWSFYNGTTWAENLTNEQFILAASSRVEVTAGGDCPITGSIHTVDGASGAADQIDDFTGMVAGEFCFISIDDTGAPITIANSATINTPGGRNIVLTAADDMCIVFALSATIAVCWPVTNADLKLLPEAGTKLTIAAGTAVVTSSHHAIDGASDTDDDLDTLTGAVVGQRLWLYPDDDAATITIKHAIAADKFYCPGGQDILLAEDTDYAYMIYNGTQWIVLAASTLALAGSGIGAALALTTNGNGAALVGVEDAAASIVAATVEAAIAELATPVTLTKASEASDVIAVTLAGPAHVAQYYAQALVSTTGLPDVAVFTMAETGAGAEVTTTAQAAQVITTDANGAAVISVTDVAGASGKTSILLVTPCSVQAGSKAGAAAAVSMTFD